MTIKKLPKSSDQEIRELLAQNLELNEEMFKMIKSIKLYVVGQRVWFIIKLIIIIIPIAIGVIYLPPILKDVLAQYQSALGSIGTVGDSMNTLNSLK